MTTTNSFLTFLDAGTSESGRTRIVNVFNATSGQFLGNLHWAAGWRRYVFHPIGDTYYDAGCLTEIVTYIGQLMQTRKR
jgi:hypothetical protein